MSGLYQSRLETKKFQLDYDFALSKRPLIGIMTKMYMCSVYHVRVMSQCGDRKIEILFVSQFVAGFY